MKTLLSTWMQYLLHSGLTKEQVQNKLEEQKTLEMELKATMESDEALLVSLSRLGAPLGIVTPTAIPKPSRFMLVLLFSQLVLSQLPQILGYPLSQANELSYFMNLILLTLGYMAISLGKGQQKILVWMLATLGATAVLANLQLAFWGTAQSQTTILTILHLAFFWVLALAIFGNQEPIRVRIALHLKFLCELLLLSFLLFCAVMLTMLLTILLFESVGISIEDGLSRFVVTGLFPLIPLLSIHLLATKANHINSLIQLLATLFLPIITLVLAVFLGVLLVANPSIQEDRTLLLGIDVLLVLVLLMILYASDLYEHPLWNLLVLVAILLALLVDVRALIAIGARFSLYGVSPNRMAVLGENLLLFANLTALAIAKLKKRPTENLQGTFLLVYLLWFAFVALLFPPLFGWQ